MPPIYQRLDKPWLDRFVNPATPFPVDWMPWGNLLVKFGLFSARPASVWTFLVRDLAGRAVNHTHELAELRRDQLPSLGIQDSSTQPLVGLRQVGRVAFAKKEGFGINDNTDISINNSSLIRTMTGGNIDQSAPARRLRRLQGELALPPNFLDQGPHPGYGH